MNALYYKNENDPYFRGVQVDNNALRELPELATDFSHMINVVYLENIDIDIEFSLLEGVLGINDALDGLQTSSFEEKIPTKRREIDII